MTGRRTNGARTPAAALRALVALVALLTLCVGIPLVLIALAPTSFPHGGTIYGRYEGGELGGEKFDAIEVRDDVLITRSGPTYSYLRWGGRVTIVAHGPP